MNNKLTGVVTLAFVMGGVSNKTKKPYLQVSNGLEAFFVTIGKDVEIDENTFNDLEEGDEITIEVAQKVGSSRVTLIGFN